MQKLTWIAVLLFAVNLTAIGADTESEYMEDTFAIAAEGEKVSAKMVVSAHSPLSFSI